MLSIGSRGADVSRLQNALRSAGYDLGTADGIYGSKTKAAVSAFQRSKGLQADGVVGSKTSGALQSYYQDGFDTGSVTTNNATGGVDGRAQIAQTTNAGRRNQMISGSLTVNGHSYDFRSGGYGNGSLPRGTYTVREHMHSRDTAGMTVGGVGYSFAVSDKYDPRVGATRSLLRIHPDGGSAGTQGCIGIVGNADVQRRFRADMEAEIRRNGGSYTLQVG
ncbi:MAG TPA: peptidoglycan-binding domain-containing protein [Myxococcales bacterium]|jgi:peptidoglycan hydrolase-like protein with peptidoglycan-binding domain